MKIKFALPRWLEWLIPARVRSEQERRAVAFGKASTSFLGGILTVTTVTELIDG